MTVPIEKRFLLRIKDDRMADLKQKCFSGQPLLSVTKSLLNTGSLRSGGGGSFIKQLRINVLNVVLMPMFVRWVVPYQRKIEGALLSDAFLERRPDFSPCPLSLVALC